MTNVAVTELDVRHVAALARLGLDDARVPALVAELNGILVHMDVLNRVKTDGPAVGGVGAGGMPLRADEGPQYPLAHSRPSFAPAMRANLFLVPRLATHAAVDGVADDAVDSSVDDAVAADALAAENTYVYDDPRPADAPAADEEGRR